ncbi:hypothetical protein X777_11938 [Ooceraea biroi]|uniref:Uncharacterized protein n=1 Tax=Ooceraea biroi TaxID=2015173 RepID=A0A026W0G1_OOCBI|nr:hypothetical protein X777_11938 [Ooceraea biroi]
MQRCASAPALAQCICGAERPASVSDAVRRVNERASERASQAVRQAGRQACPMVTAITAHASRLPRPRREHKQTSR